MDKQISTLTPITTPLGNFENIYVETEDENEIASFRSRKAKLSELKVGNSILFNNATLSTITTLGTSDSLVPTQNAVKQYVDTEVAANVDSSGIIKELAGGTIPDRHLETNGSAVSRVTYANLFSKIGTNYGLGDGVNTFNIPNQFSIQNEYINYTNVLAQYLKIFIEVGDYVYAFPTTGADYLKVHKTTKAITLLTGLANATRTDIVLFNNKLYIPYTTAMDIIDTTTDVVNSSTQTFANINKVPVLYNDLIYLFSIGSTILEIYNPSADTFITSPTVFNARTRYGAYVYNGLIFVTTNSNYIEIYNPALDSVTDSISLGAAGGIGLVVGTYLYITQSLAAIVKYDLVNNTYTSIPTTAVYTFGSFLHLFNDWLFIFGTNSATHFRAINLTTLKTKVFRYDVDAITTLGGCSIDDTHCFIGTGSSFNSILDLKIIRKIIKT